MSEEMRWRVDAVSSTIDRCLDGLVSITTTSMMVDTVLLMRRIRGVLVLCRGLSWAQAWPSVQRSDELEETRVRDT